MMHDIYLYGHLKEEFGPKFRFDVATAGEAIRALNCAFPKRFIAEMEKGSYRVVRGDTDDGLDIELEYINSFKIGNAELHIIPVAAGSKSQGTSGTVKAVAGIALIGAAIFFSGGTLAAPLSAMGSAIPGTAILGSAGISYGTIALMGLSVALLGAATLLAKAPTNNDNTSSFAFTGPINVDQQGSGVSLIFGEVICGSQAVSAGFDVENIGEG
jgi:predicted phage tail protein